MGAESYIIAFGGFDMAISDCLDYDRLFYQEVRPGAIVTSHLFRCVSEHGSQGLADAFGIGLRDFNKFANLPTDEQTIERVRCWAELNGHLDHFEYFLRLLNKNFKFMFFPNF